MQSKTESSLRDYKILNKLGEGKFGQVFAAIYTKTGSLFALKKVKKEVIKTHLMIEQIVTEIKIQSYCNHKNIVKLYDCFHDSNYLYLVL